MATPLIHAVYAVVLAATAAAESPAPAATESPAPSTGATTGITQAP